MDNKIITICKNHLKVNVYKDSVSLGAAAARFLVDELRLIICKNEG